MITMPKVPRYSQFRPASEAASVAKRRNRSRDTRAEMLLRRELWRRGLRYRLHDGSLPGKPDIVFRRARVAVFVDGDFWHGRNWEERRTKLQHGANAAYWIPKIEANIARDRFTTAALKRLGWKVARLWETDVLANPLRAANRVQRLIGQTPFRV
ncbi:MAG TPA: very short patch repair endonuclease [Thermoanaerobaculia bacterium]|nr:very short patch repair endonuclease [Thermoanaerobaculia bacterium]